MSLIENLNSTGLAGVAGWEKPRSSVGDRHTDWSDEGPDAQTESHRTREIVIQSLLEVVKKRWFLFSLLVVIPGGLWGGSFIDPRDLASISQQYASFLGPFVTALVLFLMAVTLDSKKLMASLRAPGPVIWSTSVNFIAMPLAVMPLAWLQLTEDFAVGLAIAACVPSTLAAASVWTRKADGNDAVSLLVTIITNGSCFLVTPFWLGWVIGDAIAFDIPQMMQRLFITALLPIACGQLCRLNSQVRHAADRHKTGLGAAAQVLILLLVGWASVKGGPQLASGGAGLAWNAVGLVWLSCIALHLAAMGLSFMGGQLWGFRRPDVAGTVFSGSQKTLPIGIYIATDLLSGRGLPFAAFPILMFHASQLIIDTLLTDPLKHWVNHESPPAPNSTPKPE